MCKDQSETPSKRLNMYGKRLSDLHLNDIQRLAEEGMQEGAEIEFKVALPARKGVDPWASGEDRIGDYARNELIAEVIAFANAYGGTLFVGVEETATKPARAKALSPIRNCAELAERLKLQCRDCIEPKVPILEAEGVVVSEDGSGIVVLQVPRSRMAPHRHTVTKECYVRRGDRTEKMTMREIQDLTLQVERGLAALDAKFRERQRAFPLELEEYLEDGMGYGLRATAIPTTPLYIERTFGNEEVPPPALSLYGAMSLSLLKFAGQASLVDEAMLPS